MRAGGTEFRLHRSIRWVIGMWMSNLYIVIDRENVDRNTLHDIAAAIAHGGATVFGIDEENFVIEAAMPSSELPIVRAMEGVCYVRCAFNYFRTVPAPARAA